MTWIRHCNTMQNCHRGFMKGFGLKMNIYSFTEEELLNNIQEVLNNPKYSATIKRASEIFRSQPMTPQHRVVHWTEHVIKYGGKQLRSSAMDLPVYQFLMLDVVGFMLTIVTVICMCGIYILRLFIRKCVWWWDRRHRKRRSNKVDVCFNQIYAIIIRKFVKSNSSEI